MDDKILVLGRGKAWTSEGASAGDSSVVGREVKESFRRETLWRVDKFDGDIYGFMKDRKAEAVAVLDGHRPWDMSETEAGRLVEAFEKIQHWLAAPGLDAKTVELWTPDKMVDGALERLFHSQVQPSEVVEFGGNLLVTVGITALLNLLKGDAETAFSNANSYLGVGDSSTAAAVGQTDLQAATNKLRKAMNSSYPLDSAPTIDFQSTFGSSEANFAWEEVATFNASSAGDMLNRKVQALGTKSAGATWTLTETITWS